MAIAARAQAAEIVLEQSAVQKLVVQGLFKDNGRYYIQRGACSAYLESPTVTLVAGRVVIRAHLNARLGLDLGASCAGVALTSWAVVSGAPSAQGAVVRLAEIRIDDVDDPNARMVLNSGLVPSIPTAFELDVPRAVQSMLQGQGQIQAEVQALQIEAVSVTANQLSIRFEFRLTGR